MQDPHMHIIVHNSIIVTHIASLPSNSSNTYHLSFTCMFQLTFRYAIFKLILAIESWEISCEITFSLYRNVIEMNQ